VITYSMFCVRSAAVLKPAGCAATVDVSCPLENQGAVAMKHLLPVCFCMASEFMFLQWTRCSLLKIGACDWCVTDLCLTRKCRIWSNL